VAGVVRWHPVPPRDRAPARRLLEPVRDASRGTAGEHGRGAAGSPGLPSGDLARLRIGQPGIRRGVHRPRWARARPGFPARARRSAADPHPDELRRRRSPRGGRAAHRDRGSPGHGRPGVLRLRFQERGGRQSDLGPDADRGRQPVAPQRRRRAGRDRHRGSRGLVPPPAARGMGHCVVADSDRVGRDGRGRIPQRERRPRLLPHSVRHGCARAHLDDLARRRMA
jgi:hypothetical protein